MIKVLGAETAWTGHVKTGKRQSLGSKEIAKRAGETSRVQRDTRLLGPHHATDSGAWSCGTLSEAPKTRLASEYRRCSARITPSHRSTRIQG